MPKLRARCEKQGDVAVLWVYGDIGYEADAASVVQAINEIPRDTPIVVRINSLGGYVFDGIAIYSALRERKNVTTRIDGIAASAAAIIALAGRPVQSNKHGQLYVHRAWMAAVGNAKTMREAAAWLDKIDESIIEIVSAKTHKDRDTVVRWLDGEDDGTLFNASEAMNSGLVDVVLPEEQESTAPGDSTPGTPQDAVPAIHAFIPQNPPGGDGIGIEGEWTRPTLGDFTEDRWQDLTEEERRKIARYFGFAASLETFDDLKFPHHFPPSAGDKDGKPSLNGVRTALARLPQVKGISEEDKRRIEAHLRAHLPQEDSSSRDDSGKVIADALRRLLLRRVEYATSG